MDHTHAPHPAERSIWLVRHAQAAARAPDDADDAARPLIPRGVDQAARLASALAAWDARPDVVLSSPWLRAQQTAEALRAEAPLRFLDALAAPDPAAANAAIAGALAATDRVVLVVGHEPWLAALASWWLTGREDALQIAFRKTSAMSLVGVPGPGGMTLTGFVPLRWVKAMQRG